MTRGASPTEASNEIASPSSGLRWFFLGICCALLVILLISGILAARSIRRIHAEEIAVTRALANRAEMLSGLWLSIQSYNEAVQQFVTDAQADREEPVRHQLDQLASEIDSNFKRYPVEVDSSETVLVNGLKGVFLQQKTAYISILEKGSGARRGQAQSLIANNMAALQKQILDWSGRIGSWNGDRLNHVDRALVTEFDRAQAGLARALAIGFGSGSLLVFVGMAYVIRLERQVHTKYTQLVQNQRELRQLSARLVEAQESERRSISRELHDGVGQTLGALLVDLGRFSTALSDDRVEEKVQVERMKSSADRTFQAIRNIALLLRPSMLDDLGLVPALEWQGREVSRHSDIEVEVESENVSDDLPDGYRVCIYRIVQEALNNSVRHSGARNAKVIVRQSPQGITVRVTDDGRGFDVQRVRGLGLIGMEERVKRLGGSLSLVSNPGQGVIVTAELPFSSADGGVP